MIIKVIVIIIHNKTGNSNNWKVMYESPRTSVGKWPIIRCKEVLKHITISDMLLAETRATREFSLSCGVTETTVDSESSFK